MSKRAVDNLARCRAKLYLGHGTEDQAVPVESFDYMIVEPLRRGRTDATVKRYVGSDHSFIKAGEEPSNEPFQNVIAEAVAWAEGDSQQDIGPHR